MENPHEERQNILLTRIIKNVDLLNDALIELNRSIHEINVHNQDVTLVSQMFANYSRNTQFNLAALAQDEEEQSKAGGEAQ